MQMTLTHMKKCSTTFIIREILIKTTVRYNFSPIILAKSQNFDIILCWQDFEEQEHLMIEMQNSVTPMKGNFGSICKMSSAFTLRPSHPTSRTFSHRYTGKNTKTHMLRLCGSALLEIAKSWN